LVYMLAPTSTERRIRAVVERSTGFVYLVSVTGVTGARRDLPASLEQFVGRVRAQTDKPLAVGFGISTPDQASQVARFADGVIVGSALIDAVVNPVQNRSNATLVDGNQPVAAAAQFITALRDRLACG
jgi:tryptophan synthase alpha chain